MDARAVTIWNDTDRRRLIRYLEAVEIDPMRPPMFKWIPYSDPVTKYQRGFYRGVVIKTLSDYLGYEESEVHEILLYGFAETAGYHVAADYADVREFEIVNARHMAEYLEIVIRWAATAIGCDISASTGVARRG